MRNCGGAEVAPEGKKLLSRFRTLEKELKKNRGCAAASLAGRGRKLVNKLETDMLMY